MGRVALLDMDEAVYVAAFSTQKHWYVVRDEKGREVFKHTKKAETIRMIGNKDYTLTSEMEYLGVDPGITRLRSWITDMMEASKCSEYRMFFNGANNF